jgi:hypothetical protein
MTCALLGITTMNQASNNRRMSPRYRVHLAVEIDAGERKSRVGISQDASVEGIRFNTRSKFNPGDELLIKIHMPISHEVRGITAQVVRVEEASLESTLPWRNLVAAHFVQPLNDLEPVLQEFAKASKAQQQAN